MPSRTHQWLLTWAARRMEMDGFIVCGFDGLAPAGQEWSQLERPFLLRGVRADAWGHRSDDQLIAFGEAKTFHDIDNVHTRKQLATLCKTRMRGCRLPCPVYVAIPRSAVYELDRVLIDLGLLRSKNVVRLHVPDSLIKETSRGSWQIDHASA